MYTDKNLLGVRQGGRELCMFCAPICKIKQVCIYVALFLGSHMCFTLLLERQEHFSYDTMQGRD